MEIHNKWGAGAVGLLLIENMTINDANALSQAKRTLEASLRERYGAIGRGELKALHPMDVYVSYYKKFGYTYHVLPQLESVLRGKAIPDVLPPVEAMFMAELKNGLLTAGHDMDRICLPLCFAVASQEAQYMTMGGREAAVVVGDAVAEDREGVISSILRGPDRRTAITEGTRRVLYTVYAPAGIGTETVKAHLADMETYVRLFSKNAVAVLSEVL